MKFGFYFERSGENDNDEINVNACPTCTNNQNGQFTFTDSRSGFPGTGNAIGNTALGLFDSYSELGQRAYTVFRGCSYEPFAQDSWKVNQSSRSTMVSATPSSFLIRRCGATWPCSIQRSTIRRRPWVLSDPVECRSSDSRGNGDRYNGMVIPGNGFPDSAKGRFPEATSGQYDYLFRGGKYPNYYSHIQWDQVQPRLGIAYQLDPTKLFSASAAGAISLGSGSATPSSLAAIRRSNPPRT